MQTDRPLCCTLTTRGQSLHAGQGAPTGEAAPRKAGSRPASSDRRLGSRSGAGSRRADIPRGRRGRGPPICAPGSGYSTRAPSVMLPEQGFCRRPPVTRSAGTSSAGVSSRSPDGETEGEGSDGTVGMESARHPEPPRPQMLCSLPTLGAGSSLSGSGRLGQLWRLRGSGSVSRGPEAPPGVGGMGNRHVPAPPPPPARERRAGQPGPRLGTEDQGGERGLGGQGSRCPVAAVARGKVPVSRRLGARPAQRGAFPGTPGAGAQSRRGR